MKFLGVPWGLRPRRTEQKLALSLLSMLPSAHVNRVGVRIVSFRGSMATPPILYLRFAGSLAVAAQDSRPSGSLLLSCKALSSSTSCRFIPAHCNRLFTSTVWLPMGIRYLAAPGRCNDRTLTRRTVLASPNGEFPDGSGLCCSLRAYFLRHLSFSDPAQPVLRPLS